MYLFLKNSSDAPNVKKDYFASTEVLLITGLCYPLK